jgi:hypothetical protein
MSVELAENYEPSAAVVGSLAKRLLDTNGAHRHS